ncbi:MULTISPECIES: hypothetical protein [Streptomyces]|uniref:Uncharacterized protein n=1 Tax=Streptomyces mutomycini TaxID=284036 RepID=A0ABW0B9W0_9ACTN|nr:MULTISPECIES: hypothetical protein [Streptomyces]KPC84096.1 hypothetical protein ADK82_04490 [Streptomyces sp. NRRL S-4]
MGDFFERVVDLEVTGEEAGTLAARMVDWMVAEGVITRETTGDAMYSLPVDVGHVPGPGWTRAVADDSDPSWFPGPVAVLVGRDHHVGGQGQHAADTATCPRCGVSTVVIDYPESFEADDEVWQPFMDGIEAWRKTGRGEVACSACEALVPVTEWEFGPGFDLGALAFDFWGWPPLSVRFLAEFRARLGHRTEGQSGKF